MTVLGTLQETLRCPDCHEHRLEASASQILCVSCGAVYAVNRGVPILLHGSNMVFPPAAYRSAVLPRSRGIRRIMPGPSVNLSLRKSIKRFRAELPRGSVSRVLVVGSGDQRPVVEGALGDGHRIDLTLCDVDLRADVDVLCDAHELPFRDESFDGVIATEVLEHVVDPYRVATELHRILRPAGLLYTEIPFLQGVHEGAYDFTRYTLSGHRRLLNRFDELDSGGVAGPATSLVWALEAFIVALAPRPAGRQIARGLARALFFWIKYFDYLLQHRPGASDGASCTYFLGRRREIAIPDERIIERYSGAQSLRHF